MSIFARSLAFGFLAFSASCGTAKFSGNGSDKHIPVVPMGSAGQDPKNCVAPAAGVTVPVIIVPGVSVPVVTVPVVTVPVLTVPVVTVPVVTVPVPADEDPNQNGGNVAGTPVAPTSSENAVVPTVPSPSEGPVVVHSDDQPTVAAPVVAADSQHLETCPSGIGTANPAKK